VMNLLYATIHYKKQFHEIRTKNLEPIKISRTDIDSTFILFLKCVFVFQAFSSRKEGQYLYPFVFKII